MGWSTMAEMTRAQSGRAVYPRVEMASHSCKWYLEMCTERVEEGRWERYFIRTLKRSEYGCDRVHVCKIACRL